jgi:outer membrane lipoprotein-sorting protein
MTKRIFLVALTLGTLLAPVAEAAPTVPNAMVAIDANAVLTEVDRRADAFDDHRYNATMDIIKGGQLKKTLIFEAIMKGLEKQLITFTGPGDVAGMKVLMDGPNSLKVYLPEFKKVRNVALHATDQGFMGSTFRYEDMAQVKLSTHFKAEFGPKSATVTTLVLTPKEGVESAYSKLEVDIDKTKGGVTQIRYFDGSGKAVRQQTRSEWVKIEGKLIPTEISMLDLKTGDVSVIRMSDHVVNQGVDASMFTRRELLRG